MPWDGTSGLLTGADTMSGPSTSPRARRWPRRPLGNQAFLGVAGLLALFVAFAALAILLVAKLNREENHSNTANIAYVNAVQEAALQAKGIANDQRGFLLSGDQQFLDAAERRAADAVAAFAAASSAARENSERDAIGAAKDGFDRWYAAGRLEVDQFQNGDRQDAINQSLTSDRDLRKDYEASIAMAQQIGTTGVRADRDTVAQAAAQTIRLLLAGLVVALVIGVLIGLWLLRSIARPLYRLMDHFFP